MSASPPPSSSTKTPAGQRPSPVASGQAGHAQARPAVPISRWLLLVISIVLLAGGVLMRLTNFVEPGSREFAAGSLFKVGMMLGLAWLAAPQLERLGWERLRGTGLAIIIAIGGLSAVRPRLGAIAAGVAIAGFLTLSLLGWVRGVIFNGTAAAATTEKRRKIEKNPTKR